MTAEYHAMGHYGTRMRRTQVDGRLLIVQTHTVHQNCGCRVAAFVGSALVNNQRVELRPIEVYHMHRLAEHLLNRDLGSCVQEPDLTVRALGKYIDCRFCKNLRGNRPG